MLADKKKLLIIGAVVLVVLALGVFQLGGSSPAPAASKKSASHHKGEVASNAPVTPESGAVSETAAGADAPKGAAKKGVPAVQSEADLNERDPFDGARFAPKQVTQSAPANNPAPMPRVLGGKFSTTPVAPIIGVNGAPTGPLPLGAPVAVKKDDFDYSVSGVITGDRPAAVFTDSKGNQRLITVGGSLDGDTRVVGVTRGKVTVRYHGKNLTMTVGANNPTEKRSDEK
jgi:hypothetical protein